MSDTKKSEAFSGVKQAWANPKARKGIILTSAAAAVLLLVSGLMLKSGDKKAAGIESAASVAPAPVVRPDVTAGVSPQYKEMLLKQEDQRAKEVAKTDLGMALPGVVGLTEAKVKPVEPAAAPAPAAAPYQGAAPAAGSTQSEAQARAQAEQAIRGSAAYNVAGAFMTSVAQQVTSARTSQLEVVRAQGAPVAAQGAQNPAGGIPPAAPSGVQQVAQQGGPARAGMPPSAAGAMPATPAQVLIRAGSAQFATMDTAINSDYSGPVVATIRQGPFQGAQVIGTKGLEYNAVVLKFTSISLPTGGPAIPVQAYAINLGDVSKFGTTGLAGDVDYHVMQRYVLPALLAFGTTYGYAASVTGTTMTSNGLSTMQSTNPLSSQDRALVALGGALGPVAADLARQAARPVTVRMDANTEIGILFMQDVTDKNKQQAAAAAAQGLVMTEQGVVPAGQATGQGASPQGSNTAPTTSMNTGPYGTQPQMPFGAVTPGYGYGAPFNSGAPVYTAPYSPAGAVYRR